MLNKQSSCYIGLLVSLVADDVFTTEVGNKEVAAVDCDKESSGCHDWAEKILFSESGDDEATEFHAKDGMDDSNEKRKGEEDGNLAEKCAVQHFFAGTNLAKHTEFFAVIAAFGKFFEGENSGAGNEEDEAEI